MEEPFVAVVPSKSDAVARAAATIGMPESEVAESPHVLIGSTGEICERLIRLREELGLSYIGMSAAHIDEFAPVVAQLAGS